MQSRLLLIALVCMSVFAPLRAQDPAPPEALSKRRPLPFTVPDKKRVRVIVSSDAACEVDDPYAILHALLTPQFIVKGVVAAHFNNRAADTMERSHAEIERLLALGDFKAEIPALRGAVKPLADETHANLSEGADLIVREALSDDKHPLYVLVMGPLTDVASAYLQKPEIVGRLTVVWIGGGPYPEGNKEYNLSGDISAANVVFQSGLGVWQIPSNAYAQSRVGTAELALRVRPCGEMGVYLFEKMLSFNRTRDWPRGEDWTLGDNPAVGVLLNPRPDTDRFDLVPAPRFAPDGKYIARPGAPTIRVYRNIDGRVLLEDFFAKFQLSYGKADF